MRPLARSVKPPNHQNGPMIRKVEKCASKTFLIATFNPTICSAYLDRFCQEKKASRMILNLIYYFNKNVDNGKMEPQNIMENAN